METIISPSKNLKEPQEEETWGKKKKKNPIEGIYQIQNTLVPHKRAYTERNTVHFEDQDFSSETMQDTG